MEKKVIRKLFPKKKIDRIFFIWTVVLVFLGGTACFLPNVSKVAFYTFGIWALFFLFYVIVKIARNY